MAEGTEVPEEHKLRREQRKKGGKEEQEKGGKGSEK